MLELFREIKDTPTPSLLVAGGMIFLVLAVAGRIMGKVEVPPQHQRTAGAIGVFLLLGGIVLQIAPVLLRPIASDPSAAAAAGGVVDTPLSPTLVPTTVLPTVPPSTAIPSTPAPLPTAQPMPATSPAPPGRSPEDSLRDYWRAVSEQRYADAWPMLSANFRWTTHNNDFDAYVHGYEEQGLCDVAPDNLATETQTDDYALITATMIYHKGADCAASPLGLIFHMAPADDHAFWRIDRVELR